MVLLFQKSPFTKMSFSRDGPIVYMMIDNRAQIDVPKKVVLLINHALKGDAFQVKFTGQHSGKTMAVESEKHGSRALIARTPVFHHPEICDVAVILQSTKQVVCKYNGVFTFYSKLMIMRELLSQALDPVHFMCTTLDVNPCRLDKLDTELEEIFCKRCPNKIDYLKGDASAKHENSKSVYEEFPTLLHFAARYGLWKLSYALIKCHGGHKALYMSNSKGFDPGALAKEYGHQELYLVLEDTKAKITYHSDGLEDKVYDSFVSLYDSPSHIYNDLSDLTACRDYEDMHFGQDSGMYVTIRNNQAAHGDDLTITEVVVQRLENLLNSPAEKIKEELPFVLLYAKTKLDDLKGASSKEPEDDKTYENSQSLGLGKAPPPDAVSIYSNDKGSRQPQETDQQNSGIGNEQRPQHPLPRGVKAPVPLPRIFSVNSRTGSVASNEEEPRYVCMDSAPSVPPRR